MVKCNVCARHDVEPNDLENFAHESIETAQAWEARAKSNRTWHPIRAHHLRREAALLRKVAANVREAEGPLAREKYRRAARDLGRALKRMGRVDQDLSEERTELAALYEHVDSHTKLELRADKGQGGHSTH